MKKTTLTTSKNLSKRLAQYGALTAAIAGVADANGQIIYTDIADVTIDGVNPAYTLDLNNETSGDYLLRVQPNDSFGNPAANPAAFLFPITSSYYNSNRIVGSSSFGYQYPYNLNAGAIISSGNNLMASYARGDMNWNSCAYPNSQFCDGNDGYLGFHFAIGTDTHYGWARVQVATNPLTMTIKDYAYNSVAGEPIEAGQTLSVNDYAVNEVKIVSLNKTVALYNLPENTDYKLLDISGKAVMQGSINDNTYVIEANSLSNGIYIVELTDTFTKAVIRKKIVL